MDRARGPVARRLEATTPDGLDAITGFIHDAHFDPDEVEYDEAAQRLTIPFAQEDQDWDQEPPWELLRTTPWYADHRVPFYAGRLTVHHVTAFEPPDDLEDMWSLVGIRYDAGRVRIDAFDELVATVERLHVEADLTTSVALNVRRRVYRFLNAERDQVM